MPRQPKSRYSTFENRLWTWQDCRIDVDTFTIYVGSDEREDHATNSEVGVEHGVTFAMADRFEQNMAFLAKMDADRPITIYLGSEGGNWEDGMQMFGALLNSPNPTTIIGIKHCRSMTSIIPLAADKFVMRPPTEYMIHYGYWGFEGTAKGEAESAYASLQRSNQMMERIYIARLQSQGRFSKSPTSEISEFLRDNFDRRVDAFFSTTETAALGFTDGVVRGPVSLATKINQARRDSMYAAIID